MNRVLCAMDGDGWVYPGSFTGDPQAAADFVAGLNHVQPGMWTVAVLWQAP